MKIAVYCGSNLGSNPAYKEAAVELGTWMAQNGHVLVYGGGRRGLMGVVSNAVIDAGGQAIGVIPHFLATTEKQNFRLDQIEYVDTMPERKTRMIELSDVFIALPGGPGTLEEISEIISLNRLERNLSPCIVYNVDHFYDEFASYLDKMEEEGFMSYPERKRILIAQTLDDIIEIVGGIFTFCYEPDRIWVSGKNGEVLAEVTFPYVDGVRVVKHTFVDESLRGKGVATRLMHELVKVLRENDEEARLECSFAIQWFKKHTDFRDVVM
ncbi:MAG: TIGR00730 family Rossman fold protein [Faecalicoccus sp.]|nr:TIGR00730 family Rossman fold protein [Faecalicoccus sp.]